jgi:hypothetical protein
LTVTGPGVRIPRSPQKIKNKPAKRQCFSGFIFISYSLNNTVYYLLHLIQQLL